MWGEVSQVEWDEDHQNWKCKVEGKDIDGEDMSIIVGICDDNAIIVTAC